MIKKIFLAALVALSVTPAVASSASQDVIGYYTTSCGSAPSPCFVQYGATVPVSIDGSGSSLVGVKGVDGSTIATTANPFPIQGSRSQGSTTSGQTGILVMQATTTAPPAYTNAQTNSITGDTHGGTRVVCQDTNGTVCDFTLPTITIVSSQYPNGATQINGNATGTTGSVVGTLAGTSGKTTYICGFNISATGGVATLGPIVVAGIKTASQTYQLFSTATGAQLSQSFGQCLPASATNTAITVTTTADATASAVDVNSWGYQL